MQGQWQGQQGSGVYGGGDSRGGFSHALSSSPLRPDDERRVAGNNQFYTRRQFLDFFGGTAEWDAAPAAPPPREGGPIEVYHGDPIVDRKSIFQAHCAAVRGMDDITTVMDEVLSDRKVARASHNIMAYRVWDEERGLFLQDNDDDGESAAGSKLAHLMEIMGVRGGIVVVSRWYGGTHLGPDRFKHINNCGRIALEACGLAVARTSKGGSGGGGGGGGGKTKAKAGGGNGSGKSGGGKTKGGKHGKHPKR